MMDKLIIAKDIDYTAECLQKAGEAITAALANNKTPSTEVTAKIVEVTLKLVEIHLNMAIKYINNLKLEVV